MISRRDLLAGILATSTIGRLQGALKTQAPRAWDSIKFIKTRPSFSNVVGYIGERSDGLLVIATRAYLGSMYDKRGITKCQQEALELFNSYLSSECDCTCTGTCKFHDEYIQEHYDAYKSKAQPY